MKCLECETLTAEKPDPRIPPLDDGISLCGDCYFDVLQGLVSEYEDQLREAEEHLAKERERDQYEQGFIDGLTLYAWWKDGTQYVGTTGTTLKEAVAEFRRKRK